MTEILTMLWIVIVFWFVIEVINSKITKNKKSESSSLETDNEK